MKNADINDILEELNLTCLKELAKELGISEEYKRRSPYLSWLNRREWDEKKKELLITKLKKSRQNRESYSVAQIIKSDDLSSLSDKDVMDTLQASPPRKKEESFLEGFDDVIKEGKQITGIFTGISSRIHIIGKEVVKEDKIISIPFIIFRSEGFILIKSTKTKEAKMCREKLKEILELNKLYFATPEKMRNESLDSEEYNLQTKQFIDKLEVDEINGVFLKIDGDTKIRSIKYKGNGDIREEDKIKEDLESGALIVGIKGILRHQDFFIDFSINWNWIPNIKISGEEISQSVLDELLEKVYRTYSSEML